MAGGVRNGSGRPAARVKRVPLGLCLILSAAVLAFAGAASAETWRGLTVAPEHRCAPYDRDDYPYPQSVERDIIARMGGRIYGPYTGTHFDSRRQTDIEHMVAASEAHDSGLCSASLLFWAVCIAETFSDGVGVVEAQRKAVAVAPCPRRLPCSVRTDDHDQRWALHRVAAPAAASSGRWRMVPLGSCSTMQLPSLER